MGVIQTIIDQHHKKVQKRNDACNELISRIDDAMKDVKAIFSASKAFVDPQFEIDWKNRNNELWPLLQKMNCSG